MFAPRSADEVIRLINEYPLATVVSCDGHSFAATLLPLLADISPNDGLVSLTGHIARSNPHVALLQRLGRAVVSFQGPHSYISPSWLRDRKQTPTWNYVAAHFLVHIELFDNPDATHQALHRIVRAMEHSNDNAWQIEELAERYQKLTVSVVGFRAYILNAQTTFKLGQGERNDVLEDIIKGLEATGQSTLAEWTSLHSRD
jgi:transcriptional regulator